jgi:hypothetical protein
MMGPQACRPHRMKPEWEGIADANSAVIIAIGKLHIWHRRTYTPPHTHAHATPQAHHQELLDKRAGSAGSGRTQGMMRMPVRA